MSKRVVVVGSGAAGTAAALAARDGGADVTVVHGGTGATSLTSGALDGAADEAGAVIKALAIHALGPCRIATSAGIVRTAGGRDLSLCDLAGVEGPVLVARVAHPAWDADDLAAAYSESDGREYVARDVALLAHTKERAMKHVELAALFDDDARLSRAAERIREALAGGSFGAVLLPPWLGIASPRAEDLSKLVGVRCGEVLVAHDGPAGARFENARAFCLERLRTVDGRATRVTSGENACTVTTTGAGVIECDAVVLATGGLVGGGLRYTPGGLHVFELGYEAPATLGYAGKPLVVPGSVHGVPPEALLSDLGAPLLERIGILGCAARIFAAGDATADRPRTLLEAFASGARAGKLASA